MTKAVLPAAAALAIGAALSPFFFVLYRLALFDTVPHDDYAPYLLWIAGHGGAFPDSPYAYRWLSVAAAWPLFEAMPLIRLSNTPESLTADTIRATAALAMLSFLALLAQAWLTARLARAEGVDRGHALAAGGVAFALAWHTQVTAIDALALLMITAALCLIRRPIAFTCLMVLSVGVNEKIALLLAIWLVIRLVLTPQDRRLLWRPALAACLAVAMYAALVLSLRLPGNAYQLTPSGYLGTILQNFAAYATGRGVLLNILPTLVLAALGLDGHRQRQSGLFARADLLVIPAMLGVALVLTQFFQAGRLVMHAAPLFIVPAVARWQQRPLT